MQFFFQLVQGKILAQQYYAYKKRGWHRSDATKTNRVILRAVKTVTQPEPGF